MRVDAFTLAFAALGAMFAAVVVALAMRVRRARAARAALHDHGALAEGEIARVLQEPNGAYLVRYRFTPAGAQAPIMRDEYVGYLVAAVPEVGTKVRVRYDPEAPERSLLARDETKAG